MKKVILKIPCPPSVNRLWKLARGRLITSKPYNLFVQDMLASLRGKEHLLDKADYYAVSMIVFPSTRRRRDLDNLFKATFDALTRAGFWQDDSQVREMHGYFGKPAMDAFAILEIEVYDPLSPERRNEKFKPEYWGEQERKYTWFTQKEIPPKAVKRRTRRRPDSEE